MSETGSRLDVPSHNDLCDELTHNDHDKRSSDVAKILHQIDEYGRKRTVKTDLFAHMMKPLDGHSEAVEIDYCWSDLDMYTFFRRFLDRFPQPERAIGVGKHLVKRAVANAFYDGEMPESVEDEIEECGSISRFLKDNGVGGYGSHDPREIKMYRTVNKLESVGAENEIVSRIEDMLDGMEHPWVFTQLVCADMAFYVGNYMILDAAAKSSSRPTDEMKETLRDAWEITDDAPVVFADWASPTRELKTELFPHAMHGVMKAEYDYEPSDIPALQESGDWLAQTKYDGARVFVHHTGDGDVRAYLNGGKDITSALPELFTEPLASQLPDHSFIFDGEATPYDADTGEVLSFQNILRRTSRSPDEMMDADETEDLEVKFKFFDCPFWNGDDIRNRPYTDRLQCVRNTFIPPFVAQTGNDLSDTFHRSLEAGHEGLVMKRKDHKYQLGTRSSDWQKWKAQPETLDVKVIGAHRGGGRISDGIGALEMAVEYDGELIQVGSVGTGFTDQQRRDLLREWETGALRNQVIEVEFEELQAGAGDGDDPDAAWALRFPSFNHKRPDGEVDTLERAADLDDKTDEFGKWKDSR